MKKYPLILLICVSFSCKTEAQMAMPVFSREVNTPGLSNGHQKGMYYFLPDIDVYYYAPAREFVYLNNGQWFFSRSLPAKYNGFDFYSCYKIRVSGKRPYLENEYYQTKYAAYRGAQYNKYNNGALAENYRVEEKGSQSSNERYKEWYNKFRKNNSVNEQATTREEPTNNPSRITSYPENYKDNYQPSNQPKQESKNSRKQSDDFDPYVETTPRENNSYIAPAPDVNEARVKIPASVVVPEQTRPSAGKTPVTNLPVSEKSGTIKPQSIPVANSPVQDSSAIAKPISSGQRSAYGSWDKKKPGDQ